MKLQKLFLVSVFLLLLSASAVAQLGNTTTVLFAGVPTGGCTSLQLAQNTSNGNLYNCFNGSWNLISGGGGGGGVSGSGTAGTLPIWLSATVLGNSSITDNGTTVATPEPINISGNGAGVISLSCSTAPSVGSGIQLTGPTSCTPHNIAFPQIPQSGFLFSTASGNLVALSYQAFIDLTQNVGTTVLPVANGGTGNATGSGALINLFPNPIKVGDLIYWNGTAWNNFTGNAGAGATSFFTEANNGNPGWVQSPIPVTNGGWGLNTLTTGCIYKGNGTGAPLCSALSDNGTNVTSSERFVTPATSTSGAGLNLPHGTVATSPVNGDLWTTTAGLFAQINGATVGPFGTGGGGGTPAFPITVTGGVSGAVPCFTSTTVESAGALLPTNAVMIGGGAGACPTASATNISAVLGALSLGSSGVAGSLTLNGATSGSLGLSLLSTGGTLQFSSLGTTTNPLFQGTGMASNTGLLFPTTSSFGFVGSGVLQSQLSSTGMSIGNGVVYGVSSSTAASGTKDTGFSRCAAGVACFGSGAQGSTAGAVESGYFIFAATKFTISGCSATTTLGGAAGGSFVSGTSGSCTVVITINGATGATAPNGWVCTANDLTTPADAMKQTSASTTTTVTLTGTTVSGDVINFGCGAA